MKIYLAGKIPKGNEIGKTADWRADYAKALSAAGDIFILSPEDDPLDESQPLLVFGHDCAFVKQADVVVINASQKLGVGTAQEILIAKYFKKPVVSILPKDTHHRRTNLVMPAATVADWIHPFIFSTSDAVVENLDQAVLWLKDHIKDPKPQNIKGLEIIDKAIEDYTLWHKAN